MKLEVQDNTGFIFNRNKSKVTCYRLLLSLTDINITSMEITECKSSGSAEAVISIVASAVANNLVCMLCVPVTSWTTTPALADKAAALRDT